MPDTPDAQLLEQFARNGSEDAFAALVERHIGLVHSVALRHTANPGHAEDITQAVFIILARKAGTLNQRTVLPGWLYSTARLTAANWQRVEARRIRREQEAFMQSSVEESETDNLWRELSPQLDRAMASLGRTDRNAVVLRYFQNKSLAETGQSLGLTENAAQKRVRNALEKLRKFFSRHGVNLTAPAIANSVSLHSVHVAPPALVKSVTTLALAKGATASVTTSTLIKGALKVMAWSKTKTAIVAGAALLVAVSSATVAFNVWFLKPSVEAVFIHHDDATYLRHAPPVTLLRPTQYANQGTWVNDSDNDARLLGRNRSLAWVLAVAYHVGSERMILPPDLPPGGFDYLITSSNARATLQNEIKNQFGLVAHVEKQTTNVLVLKVAADGVRNLKINPRTTGDDSIVIEKQKAMFGDFPMQSFAADLGGYFLKMPVVDETDLTNRYDAVMRWTGRLDGTDAVNNLLQNEFGLELVPEKRAIEMLFVEYEDGHHVGPPLPRASWAFQGYATPADAFESLLWAMNQGDAKAFLASLTPDCQKQILAKHDGGKFANRLDTENHRRAARIAAYQILNQEQLSDTETILFVRSTQLGNAQFTMKKLASEWKVDKMPD